jgi:hypothetical protein
LFAWLRSQHIRGDLRATNHFRFGYNSTARKLVTSHISGGQTMSDTLPGSAFPMANSLRMHVARTESVTCPSSSTAERVTRAAYSACCDNFSVLTFNQLFVERQRFLPLPSSPATPAGLFHNCRLANGSSYAKNNWKHAPSVRLVNRTRHGPTSRHGGES